MTNSRGQLHAAYRARAGRPYADARPAFVGALGQQYTGWGASWADLDLDGSPELAIANGAIPVTSLAKDAQRIRVVTTDGGTPSARSTPARRSRGTAAASRSRTSTTTATPTSRSTRSAARCSCSATTARRGTGSRSAGSSRARSSRRPCPTAVASCARSTPGRATSRRRIRGRASGSAVRHACAGARRTATERHDADGCGTSPPTGS